MADFPKEDRVLRSGTGGAIAEAKKRKEPHQAGSEGAIRVLAEGCNRKNADSWFMMQVRNDIG